MLSCLIVDDEQPARERLKRLIRKHSDIVILGEAESGLAALDKIERHQPSLVFLDIEMPELDGLSVAEALYRGTSSSSHKQPAVIFVTAFNEYAIKAFDVAAADYLLKPINESRLNEALAKIRRRQLNDSKTQFNHDTLLTRMNEQQPMERFAVRCGAKFLIIESERIMAVVARDHYAAILLDGKEILADDSLDVFMNRLNPQTFLRVHRGAILNLAFVRELEREGDRKFVAILNDSAKTRVPISRDKLDELKLRFGVS